MDNFICIFSELTLKFGRKNRTYFLQTIFCRLCFSPIIFELNSPFLFTVAIEELGAVQSMSVSITDDTECDELIGEENNDISKNCSEDLFKGMDFPN